MTFSWSLALPGVFLFHACTKALTPPNQVCMLCFQVFVGCVIRFQLFVMVQVHTNLKAMCLSVYGVNLWNTLPDDIKHCTLLA